MTTTDNNKLITDIFPLFILLFKFTPHVAPQHFLKRVDARRKKKRSDFDGNYIYHEGACYVTLYMKSHDDVAGNSSHLNIYNESRI